MKSDIAHKNISGGLESV